MSTEFIQAKYREGKGSPAAFGVFCFGQLTMASNAFCIKTTDTFLHSVTIVGESNMNSAYWLLWLGYIPSVILDVSPKEKSNFLSLATLLLLAFFQEFLGEGKSIVMQI